jgi:hypothetical protein
MADRVGPKGATASTPAAPLRTNTVLKPGANAGDSYQDILAQVKAGLEKRKVSGADVITDGIVPGAGTALYDNLSNSEKTSLAKLMKKLGKSVKTQTDLKTVLTVDYGSIYNNVKTYADLYKGISADVIPGLDTTSTSPTKTVLKQDPLVIDASIRAIYQAKLKRDPNANELSETRVIAQKLIDAGQVQKKIGKTAEYTPQFSAERLKAAVNQKIETGGEAVQTDIQQANSLNFADTLIKWGK